MRIAVLGSLVAVVLIALLAGLLPLGQPALGQQAAPNVASFSEQGLLAFSETVEQKYQQVTVIDPKRQTISVYHIDLANGMIALRSVRSIHWDLQMSEYNGQKPLPREIQSLLEQR